MASYDKAIEAYKNTLTTVASVAASAMLVRGAVNELVPYELRKYIYSGLNFLRSQSCSSVHNIVINENVGRSTNKVFQAVQIYLASKINTDMKSINISCVENSKKIMVSMQVGEEMVDNFEGIEFKWKLVCQDSDSDKKKEKQSYKLYFDKKFGDKVLNEYMPLILQKANEITESEQEKTLKIHMNEWEKWSSVDLHHPSTFDTLAIDSDLKQTLMDDLAMFVKGKDYYKRIGKGWKRGYLLYGPPGTGKSSLVAAIANYLKFDVYDLELAAVESNSTLRALLIGMSNRSILLIEDIDCAINLNRRDKEETSSDDDDDKITLSGLLNFIDGLWSTSGEERIIVFTTNYKERLDPALTRPGRMDMHIHMGYCSPCSFRILTKNYHLIDDHKLFPEIEELLKEVEVTPAEVAEELLKSREPDVALKGLLEFLKGKKEGKHESKNPEEEKEVMVFDGDRSRIVTQTSETNKDQIATKTRFEYVIFRLLHPWASYPKAI